MGSMGATVGMVSMWFAVGLVAAQHLDVLSSLIRNEVDADPKDLTTAEERPQVVY